MNKKAAQKIGEVVAYLLHTGLDVTPASVYVRLISVYPKCGITLKHIHQYFEERLS